MGTVYRGRGAELYAMACSWSPYVICKEGQTVALGPVDRTTGRLV